MTLGAINSGSPALTSRLKVNSLVSQPETPAHKKLRKAAQEFEGMLITQLLGDFGKGLSSLTGDAPMAGSETMNALAVQTLSQAMAGRGGFGIGNMLVHQFEPSLPRGH